MAVTAILHKVTVDSNVALIVPILHCYVEDRRYCNRGCYHVGHTMQKLSDTHV